jgi:hypothetical protein
LPLRRELLLRTHPLPFPSSKRTKPEPIVDLSVNHARTPQPLSTYCETAGLHYVAFPIIYGVLALQLPEARPPPLQNLQATRPRATGYKVQAVTCQPGPAIVGSSTTTRNLACQMVVAGNPRWWLGHIWLRSATCQPLFGQWLWLVRQATRDLTIPLQLSSLHVLRPRSARDQPLPRQLNLKDLCCVSSYLCELGLRHCDIRSVTIDHFGR